MLIVVSIPVFLIGGNLAFWCGLPSPNGCFAPLDATRGFATLIVGGLLIVGAAMTLTAGRAPHRAGNQT